MASTHLKTMGMACEVCSALVEMNLEHLTGVTSARTDLDTGLTIVLYDPREVDGLEIADEIERSGFRARVVTYPQFADGAVSPAPERARRTDLHAVHVRTSGIRCQDCTALIERTLAHLDGVVDVTAVQSMGLTSILFDDALVDRETIADAIRHAGFGAKTIG